MAQGQLMTAGAAGALGYKAAPMLRALAPVASDVGKTALVAGGGIGLVALGTWRLKSTNGAGYTGPAIVGTGVGVTLGAISDHFGF